MRAEAMTAFAKPLEHLERETPQPGAGEALVKITRAGLCHSDLHIHDGYFDLGGGQKAPVNIPLPAVLGHEIEGEVAALGAGVAGPKAGTRVAVYPWIGCGQCAACKRGEQQLCATNRNLGIARWGGMADHVLVPDATALIELGDLQPGVGALAMCSGLTAFSALKKLGAPDPAEPILLIGLGGVGLMGLSIAKALYSNPIIAVDIDASKREAALARGASEALDPNAPDAAAQFVAKTGGAYGAIDFVGAPQTVGFGMSAVRRGGRVIVVGLFGGAMPVSTAMLPIRELMLAGSYVGSLAEARDLIGLMRAGKIAPPVMDERPLSCANQAFDDLRAGKVVGRIVFTP